MEMNDPVRYQTCFDCLNGLSLHNGSKSNGNELLEANQMSEDFTRIQNLRKVEDQHVK
jgi:hypothetical protein